jgi:N-methylhydantoinase B/oxoprolinase/acetone carboxylase alpha subunit
VIARATISWCIGQPMSVAAANMDPEPGDIFMLNDPFRRG